MTSLESHTSSSRSKATPTTKACIHCRKEPHPHKKLPAKGASCHRCNKKGHCSSQCFSKRVSEVSSENVLDTAFLDTVGGKQTSAWFTTIKLNEQETRFQLDIGAEVTVISEQSYLSIQKPQLSEPEKVLYGPQGQFGEAFTQCKGGRTLCLCMVDGHKTNLLEI